MLLLTSLVSEGRGAISQLLIRGSGKGLWWLSAIGLLVRECLICHAFWVRPCYIRANPVYPTAGKIHYLENKANSSNMQTSVSFNPLRPYQMKASIATVRWAEEQPTAGVGTVA